MTDLFMRHGETAQANAKDAKGRPLLHRKRMCNRCGGAGRSDRWAFTGFTCFDCEGRGTLGTENVKLYTADELAKLNVRADKIRAKKDAAHQAQMAAKAAAEAAAKAERAAAMATDPVYLAIAAELEHGPSDFLEAMLARVQIGELTERQHEATERTIAARAGKRAEIAASGWIGQVGDRIEIVAKVQTVRCLRDPTPIMSGKWLVKLKTVDGATLTWFAGTGRYDQGDVLTGTAKVEEHSEFQGMKETRIKNPRWKTVAGEED